jgi:hypothetical protein
LASYEPQAEQTDSSQDTETNQKQGGSVAEMINLLLQRNIVPAKASPEAFKRVTQKIAGGARVAEISLDEVPGHEVDFSACAARLTIGKYIADEPPSAD